MDRELGEWKLDVERIWSADAPDWTEAARVAGAIARVSGEALLRQAATQALPILRHAAAEDANGEIMEAARRRLAVIREVLHELTTPKFGKRETSLKGPAPEERHRQLLGLPSGRRLSAPEIHRAFRRAASDGGGQGQSMVSGPCRVQRYQG